MRLMPGEVVLKVENLHVKDDRNQMAVEGVDLEVRKGEIVGIAGVQGNGQRELVEALTGLRKVEAGTCLGRWAGKHTPLTAKNHRTRCRPHSRRSRKTWPGYGLFAGRQYGAQQLLCETIRQWHRDAA